MTILTGPFRQAIPTPRNMYRTDVVLALDFVSSSIPVYVEEGTFYGDWLNIDGVVFERPSSAIASSSTALVNFTSNNPRITNKGLFIEGGK